MIKRIFFVSLLLVLGASLFKAGTVTALNQMAADFNLLDLGGKSVSSRDLKGKPVILFFWTTWCPYCRKEFNALKDLYPTLNQEGIVLLAVNSGEPGYKVSNFVKSRNVDFTVALDEEGLVADSFDIVGVPTYVLIDRQGRIRFKQNYFPAHDYKDLILKK